MLQRWNVLWTREIIRVPTDGIKTEGWGVELILSRAQNVSWWVYQVRVNRLWRFPLTEKEKSIFWNNSCVAGRKRCIDWLWLLQSHLKSMIYQSFLLNRFASDWTNQAEWRQILNEVLNHSGLYDGYTNLCTCLGTVVLLLIYSSGRVLRVSTWSFIYQGNTLNKMKNLCWPGLNSPIWKPIVRSRKLLACAFQPYLPEL